MIDSDQPTCFSDKLIAAVSSRHDGTMLDRTLDDRHHPTVVDNRQSFVSAAGAHYSSCVYQLIHYGEDASYDSVVEVDAPNTDGVVADVLYTETPGVGLFLPVADCVGTIIYDNTRGALALAHLGRHATVGKALKATLQLFKQKGSVASDIVIWMSPSVGQDHYLMEFFDQADDKSWKPYIQKTDDKLFLDLGGYNRKLALDEGVSESNIHLPSVDTASSPNYFSHSQGDHNARFAVLAQMKAI